MTFPAMHHRSAVLIPTILGKNHEEQPSVTIPRRAKTKPIVESVEAMRMSHGSVIVAPIPMAGPLIAAMTGLVRWKSRNTNTPPQSRTEFADVDASGRGANAFGPSD